MRTRAVDDLLNQIGMCLRDYKFCEVSLLDIENDLSHSHSSSYICVRVFLLVDSILCIHFTNDAQFRPMIWQMKMLHSIKEFLVEVEWIHQQHQRTATTTTKCMQLIPASKIAICIKASEIFINNGINAVAAVVVAVDATTDRESNFAIEKKN